MKFFETKKPKLNILELVFNSQGLPDWYLTNKYPLFNDRSHVVGLMGTVRPYGDGEKKELKWEEMMKSGEQSIMSVIIFVRKFQLVIWLRYPVCLIASFTADSLNYLELLQCNSLHERIEAACDDLLASSKKLSLIASEMDSMTKVPSPSCFEDK